MAGRPVTVRGGQSGLLYGTITFAVVSAASLGLFVFQLTKNKAAETRAANAERRIRLYGNPPAYYADEARGRDSNVFGVMSDDLRKVATLVTGVSEDIGATVEAKAERVLSDIAARKAGLVNPGDTLLTALITLDDAHTREQQAATAAAEQVATLLRSNAALTQQLKSTRDEFEGQVASLSEQLQRAQEEKVSAVQQKDGQLTEMQATLDATEAELQSLKREGNSEVRELQIELDRRRAMIDQLQQQIQSLKPGSFDPSAILTKADGRIMRAIPGSDVVYINLGAADDIKTGMGFEVYSPTRESSSLRGKASLEVVTVMEQTAECRVTRRTPGQPIVEGDTVVNIAFERSRRPKFVVRGDFDLDYDGVVDFNGIDQVNGIVRQWGGQIVDDLDESVDFVVIGLPPGAPNLAPDEYASAVVRDQAQQKALERSRFRALVEQAQKMFIPVITQNQFLFLTGYSGDGAVTRR